MSTIGWNARWVVALNNRVVNNTFWKYWQYQYQYLLQKVLPIAIPIPHEKSIANTDANTFWTILFFITYTYTYVSPVYFLSQQKKSKPSIFSQNHSGEIGLTLLPNETGVSAAAIHSLTERMNSIISKCSLLSLDRRGEKTLPTAKTVSQLMHLLAIQCSVQCIVLP